MAFAVVSDIHAHSWSMFSGVDPDGVNSRLRIQLNELERAADEMLATGGKTMIIAGDIYHTRGSIDPEVHNPLEDTFQRILNKGVDILAIPGNHDLKSRDTVALSSQVETLGKLFSGSTNFTVFNERTAIRRGRNVFGFVPWRATPAEVLVDLEALSHEPDASDMYVFMHVGLGNVLPAAEGLDPKVIEGFGFKKVFSGHYHHHKNFNDKVYSIGATAHHNWGDIGTRAGFLLVDGDNVKVRDSNAPKFVDISGMTDEDDIRLTAAGNYARVRGAPMKDEQIEELREFLEDAGAKGISIEIPKLAPVAHAHASAAAAKAMTLNESLDNYVDKKTDWPAGVDVAKVKARAQQVLRDAQANHIEA